MDEVDGQPSIGAAAVTSDAAGTPVIKLTGEIDISNVDSVRAEIDPVVEGAPSRLVFDLSALEFMDSSGIALLLQAAARCGSVELREPSDLVRRIIEVTGLTDVFRVDW